MLLVEPWARGRGIGRRLVAECVDHARELGYGRMVLYTSKGLDSARRLYEAEGFRMTEETPRHEWGADHVEQWWELTL
jgi:ribosomal protein S18 acetylase RimI-like enzyme